MERSGLRAHGKSKRLQRAASDFGADDSFEQANRKLQEHYGFELNASAVRELTLQQAQRAQCRLEAQYEEPFRVLPKKGASQLIAQADGSMICTVASGSQRNQPKPRQWKELRLMVGQEADQVQATYAATFESVDEVGRRWGHCLKEAGWSLESQIHVVADGAEWIQQQSQEVFGQQGRFLVDFYHVCQYLGEASSSCHPQAPESWRLTQQE
jgi:hypothetical protein